MHGLGRRVESKRVVEVKGGSQICRQPAVEGGEARRAVGKVRRWAGEGGGYTRMERRKECDERC
jgi:hypothetical protein